LRQKSTVRNDKCNSFIEIVLHVYNLKWNEIKS
jgi:hypothetical protein